MSFIRVIVESPYAAPPGTPGQDIIRYINLHKRYLNAAMLDCLKRGEAPFASHRMYTDCLRDSVPAERELGIQAGFAWRTAADRTVVYQDLGISGGMEYGIANSKELKIPIEYRSLEGWDQKK